jgi:hypothetical protein
MSCGLLTVRPSIAKRIASVLRCSVISALHNARIHTHLSRRADWNYFSIPNIAVPPSDSFPFFGTLGEAVREAVHE